MSGKELEIYEYVREGIREMSELCESTSEEIRI